MLDRPASSELIVTFDYYVTDTKPGIAAIKVDVLNTSGVYVNNINKTKQLSKGSSGFASFSIETKNIPTAFFIYIAASNISVIIDNITISATPTEGGCLAPISTLPVKLMNFAGSVNNNKGLLKWSVADNETGERFQVLRSVDGKNFTEAGVVFITNKVGAESYNFTDGKELDAVTYYKLKIENKDGSTSYSNVIILKSANEKATTGITIFKNPVESTLTFSYNATAAAQGQVSIYNTLGVKVYSSRIATQKGMNAVSLNLDSQMASGTYILEVVNGTERAVTRMIKQ
jgi:hypothetical protein